MLPYRRFPVPHWGSANKHSPEIYANRLYHAALHICYGKITNRKIGLMLSPLFALINVGLCTHKHKQTYNKTDIEAHVLET